MHALFYWNLWKTYQKFPYKSIFPSAEANYLTYTTAHMDHSPIITFLYNGEKNDQSLLCNPFYLILTIQLFQLSNSASLSPYFSL